MSSRRVASDALRSSSDVGSSLFNAECAAAALDSVLDLDRDGEVVSPDQIISGILKRGKQFDRFVEPEVNPLRWIEFRFIFHPAVPLGIGCVPNQRGLTGCTED
jgi:hypothetical protein